MRAHTLTPAALTASKAKAKEQEKKTAKIASSKSASSDKKGGKPNG